MSVAIYRPCVRKDGNARLGYSAHMTEKADPRDSDWQGEESRQWVALSDYTKLASDLTAAEARIRELWDFGAEQRDARIAAEARIVELDDALTELSDQAVAQIEAAEAVADRRLGLIRLARNMLRDMDAAHYAIDAELAQADNA